MQYIRADVATICIGMAASMGAVLLAAGTKGKRYALPNSDIMIHQVSGGAQGTASDIEIQAREILRMRDRLNNIFARETGRMIVRQPLELTKNLATTLTRRRNLSANTLLTKEP